MYPQPVSNIRELSIDVRVLGQSYVDNSNSGACSFTDIPLLMLVSRLIHYGPQFVYQGPFQSKVHIETLTINLSHDNPPVSDTRTLFTELFRQVSRFASTGAFTGKISRIRVCSGDSVKEVRSEHLLTQRRYIATWIHLRGLTTIIECMKHDGDRSSIVWGIEMSSKFAIEENKF